MKGKQIEGFIQYVIVSGFLLFGAGIVISILRSGMPTELTMITIGIALIIFGILSAKIFGGFLSRTT
jgi:hypothetical protein